MVASDTGKEYKVDAELVDIGVIITDVDIRKIWIAPEQVLDDPPLVQILMHSPVINNQIKQGSNKHKQYFYLVLSSASYISPTNLE